MANYTASDITTDEQAALDQIKEETEAAVKYDIAAKNAKDPVTKEAMEHNKKDELQHAGLMGAVATKENPEDKDEMMKGVEELDSIMKKSISQCIKERQGRPSSPGTFESAEEFKKASPFKKYPISDEMAQRLAEDLRNGVGVDWEKYANNNDARAVLNKERKAGLWGKEALANSWGPTGLLDRLYRMLPNETQLPSGEDAKFDPAPWVVANITPEEQAVLDPYPSYEGYTGLTLDDLISEALESAGPAPEKESPEYGAWYDQFISSLEPLFDLAVAAGDPEVVEMANHNMSSVPQLATYTEPGEPFSLTDIPAPVDLLRTKTQNLGYNADRGMNLYRTLDKASKKMREAGMRDDILADNKALGNNLMRFIHRNTGATATDVAAKNPGGAVHAITPEFANEFGQIFGKDKGDMLLNGQIKFSDDDEKDYFDQAMRKAGIPDTWFWKLMAHGYDVDQLIELLNEARTGGASGTGIDADIEEIKDRLEKEGYPELSEDAISNILNILDAANPMEEFNRPSSDTNTPSNKDKIVNSVIGDEAKDNPMIREGLVQLIEDAISDVSSKGRSGKPDIGPAGLYKTVKDRANTNSKDSAQKLLDLIEGGEEGPVMFKDESIYPRLESTIETGNPYVVMDNGKVSAKYRNSIFDHPELQPYQEKLREAGRGDISEYFRPEKDQLFANKLRWDRMAQKAQMEDTSADYYKDQTADIKDEIDKTRADADSIIEDIYSVARQDSELAEKLLSRMPPAEKYDNFKTERKALENIAKGYYQDIPALLSSAAGRDLIADYLEGEYPIYGTATPRTSQSMDLPFSDYDKETVRRYLSEHSDDKKLLDKIKKLDSMRERDGRSLKLGVDAEKFIKLQEKANSIASEYLNKHPVYDYSDQIKFDRHIPLFAGANADLLKKYSDAGQFFNYKGIGKDFLSSIMDLSREDGMAPKLGAPDLLKEDKDGVKGTPEARLRNGGLLPLDQYKERLKRYQATDEESTKAYNDLQKAIEAANAASLGKTDDEFKQMYEDAIKTKNPLYVSAANRTMKKYRDAIAGMQKAIRSATSFKPTPFVDPGAVAKNDVDKMLDLDLDLVKEGGTAMGEIGRVRESVEKLPEKAKLAAKRGDLIKELLRGVPMDALVSEVNAAKPQAYLDKVKDFDPEKHGKTSLLDAILTMNGGVDQYGLPIRSPAKKTDISELENRVKSILGAVAGIPAVERPTRPIPPTVPEEGFKTPEEKTKAQAKMKEYNDVLKPKYGNDLALYNKYIGDVVSAIKANIPEGVQDWFQNRGALDLAGAAGITPEMASKYIANQSKLQSEEAVSRLIRDATDKRAKNVADFTSAVNGSLDMGPTKAAKKILDMFPILQPIRDKIQPKSLKVQRQFADFKVPTEEEAKEMTPEQLADIDVLKNQLESFKDEAFMDYLKGARYDDERLAEVFPYPLMSDLGFAELPAEPEPTVTPESKEKKESGEEKEEKKMESEQKEAIPVTKSSTESSCTRVRRRSDADDLPDDTGLTEKDLKEPKIHDDAEGSSVKHMGDSVIKKSISELMRERMSRR